MKLKKSIKKKVLTSLLIGASLSGVVGNNVFAYSNSSEIHYASKDVSNKVINEIKQAYKARSYMTYEYFPSSSCYIVHLDGAIYGLSSNGGSLIGRCDVGGRIYYFDRYSSKAVQGWYNVKDSNRYNGRYFFDYGTCEAKKDCFDTVGNERFHFRVDGRVDMGIFDAEGHTYCGDKKTGAIKTGWWSEGGHRYFFDKDYYNGAAHQGWYRDGKAGDMYFNERGWMQEGLQFLPDGIYCFQHHGNGANAYTASGFYSTNKGVRYYFDPKQGNKALEGTWLDTGAGFYVGTGRMYFKNDGHMADGVTKINGETYLFTHPSHFSVKLNSYLTTGWYTDLYTHNTYYFNPDTNGAARSVSNTPAGAAVKGVQYIDGQRYVFNQEGVLIG